MTCAIYFSDLKVNRTSHANFHSLDPFPHYPVQFLHCSLLARIVAKMPDLKGFGPVRMQHILPYI